MFAFNLQSSIVNLDVAFLATRRATVKHVVRVIESVTVATISGNKVPLGFTPGGKEPAGVKVLAIVVSVCL